MKTTQKITFGKTESWNSGWRGNQSTTPIRINGTEIGSIRGKENTAAREMIYQLDIPANLIRPTFTPTPTNKLSDAKRQVALALVADGVAV